MKHDKCDVTCEGADICGTHKKKIVVGTFPLEHIELSFAINKNGMCCSGKPDCKCAGECSGGCS